MNEQEKKLMGQRIKQEREKKGWSQDILGDKLERNRTNVSNYESGRTVPPGNILKDMATLFGVDSDYILGLSDARRAISIIEKNTNPSSVSPEKEDELVEFEKFIKNPDHGLFFKDYLEAPEERKKEMLMFWRFIKETEGKEKNAQKEN